MSEGLYFIPSGDYMNKRSEIHALKVDKVFFHGRTKMQEVFLGHSPILGAFLALDNVIQSSEYDSSMYHESIVHPALLMMENPKNVLIIGGGEGTTAAEVLKHKDVNIDFVEIDEQVLKLCRKFLPYALKRYDKRVNLHVGDGMAFLKNTKKRYDLIICDITDAFDKSMLSRELYSEKFARLAKSKLTDQGVYVTIGCGFEKGKPSYLLTPKYLKNVFPIVRPFSFYMPSFNIQMFMVMASKRHDPIRMEREKLKRGLKNIRGLHFYNENVHYALFDPSYYKLVDDATEG